YQSRFLWAEHLLLDSGQEQAEFCASPPYPLLETIPASSNWGRNRFRAGQPLARLLETGPPQVCSPGTDYCRSSSDLFRSRSASHILTSWDFQIEAHGTSSRR